MKKYLLLFLGLGFTALSAVASVSVESTGELNCRAKAKEIAAETYRSCENEVKGAEIERLRKGYQDKLRTLKDDYEKEIEKLGGKTKSTKRAESKRMNAARKSAKAPSQTLSYEPKPEPSSQVMVDESQMDLPEPIPVQTPTDTN